MYIYTYIYMDFANILLRKWAEAVTEGRTHGGRPQWRSHTAPGWTPEPALDRVDEGHGSRVDPAWAGYHQGSFGYHQNDPCIIKGQMGIIKGRVGIINSARV